ncbi:hypothetical protein Q0F98_13165 [Paenibacillus amylolyticus]|nr:hypothetical protein Q0F98_13165 [Paenibacillus amylolyticus]
MKLSPMNQEDYASFRIRSIKDFAQEKVEGAPGLRKRHSNWRRNLMNVICQKA